MMRKSTEKMYRRIAEYYDEIVKAEGDKATHLDRGYFYDQIEEEFGVSRCTILRAIAYSRKRQNDP